MLEKKFIEEESKKTGRSKLFIEGIVEVELKDENAI